MSLVTFRFIPYLIRFSLSVTRDMNHLDTESVNVIKLSGRSTFTTGADGAFVVAVKKLKKKKPSTFHECKVTSLVGQENVFSSLLRSIL